MAKKTDSKTKAAAPAPSAIKPAAKKPAAPKAKPAPKAKAAAKAKAAPKSPKPKAPAYTPEDVALRAYFIAEKRRSLGLHGSEHGDWLEAERQLAAESKKPKKAAKT